MKQLKTNVHRVKRHGKGLPFMAKRKGDFLGRRSSNDFATIILYATAAVTSSYLFYFA
jgi:hypothetical protein